MDRNCAIQEAVRFCYYEKDINCARTTLYVLTEMTSLVLEPQVWAAAVGMHGAGRFGAQCGLVEGALMFIGIQGARIGLDEKRICGLCNAYAHSFTEHFGGLSCKILRPGGFRADDPPHLCEGLTEQSLLFAVAFFEQQGLLES